MVRRNSALVTAPWRHHFDEFDGPRSSSEEEDDEVEVRRGLYTSSSKNRRGGGVGVRILRDEEKQYRNTNRYDISSEDSDTDSGDEQNPSRGSGSRYGKSSGTRGKKKNIKCKERKGKQQRYRENEKYRGSDRDRGRRAGGYPYARAYYTPPDHYARDEEDYVESLCCAALLDARGDGRGGAAWSVLLGVVGILALFVVFACCTAGLR